MKDRKWLKLNDLEKLGFELLLAAYPRGRTKWKYKRCRGKKFLSQETVLEVKFLMKLEKLKARDKHMTRRQFWSWCKLKQHARHKANQMALLSTSCINTLIQVTMLFEFVKLGMKQYLKSIKRVKFRRELMNRKRNLCVYKKGKQDELFFEFLSSTDQKENTNMEYERQVIELVLVLAGPFGDRDD